MNFMIVSKQEEGFLLVLEEFVIAISLYKKINYLNYLNSHNISDT